MGLWNTVNSLFTQSIHYYTELNKSNHLRAVRAKPLKGSIMGFKILPLSGLVHIYLIENSFAR